MTIEALIGASTRSCVLRFMACGSVDDGKSTLLGRLLYDSQLICTDHLAALGVDSRRAGTQGGALDLALVMDGLLAEREQGITIDVAYRYFSTERRTYIVADAPGHEQYTRNMVTAASTAELAIVLVDARKGLLPQTLRHAYLATLLGIRSVVLAVNKMDAVAYAETTFNAVVAEYRAFAGRLPAHELVAIPISALRGDNVTSPSPAMPWYRGPSLMAHLEAVDPQPFAAPARDGFRMAVQWVSRPHQDFRGLAGMITGGVIRPGDRVRVMPGAQDSRVARIVTMGGDLAEAVAGQSVMLTLADELDVGRGDLLADPTALALVADRLRATIIWMGDEPLFPGRRYHLKCGARTVAVSVTALKHVMDVESFEHRPATELQCNDIGVCDLALDRAIAFDPYADNRETGGFILIDRLQNDTVGAGLIDAAQRGPDVRSQALEVDKVTRARQKGQRPCVLWFTGLSGAGKTTIGNLVEQRLHRLDRHTYFLDGDNVRLGLNRDLGFGAADRVENIRRVAEVARLMVDAGLIVLAAFISPFRAARRLARELVAPGEFVEIFIDTPLAEAERRDPKGLYRRARGGELKDFTGIDSPYEVPEAPEIHIDTTCCTPEEAADRIIEWLHGAGFGVRA